METWKPIKGYEGLYEVSDQGRVKSLINKPKEMYLKKHNRGYRQVELTNGEERKTYLVHRLVAEAFLPNPQKYPQVNHIDEDKQNNAVSNLEWCTAKQNRNAFALNHPNFYKRPRGSYKTRTPYKPRADRNRPHKADKQRNRFKILQLTLDGRLVKVWDFAICAKWEHGYNSTSIWECCEGKRRTAYGYKWQYDTSNINE